jgi:hypothetical protein
MFTLHLAEIKTHERVAVVRWASEHIYFALVSTVPHLRPLFGKILTAPRRVWPILLAAANYVLPWGLGFGEHRACDKRYLRLDNYSLSVFSPMVGSRTGTETTHWKRDFD